MPLGVTLRVAERANAPVVERALEFGDASELHRFVRALALAGRCVVHSVDVQPDETAKVQAWRGALERAALQMEDEVVKEGLRLVHARALKRAAEAAGLEARGVCVDAAESLLVCEGAARQAVLAHLREVERGVALDARRLAPPPREAEDEGEIIKVSR